jgi:hypothetical protein
LILIAEGSVNNYNYGAGTFSSSSIFNTTSTPGTTEILLGLGVEITYFNHNTASSYAFMLADIDLTLNDLWF